ncbi:hypothetical protein SAMN05216464_11989 [Mucilaginibacter pineti]|uniref:Uncharacterized protein n=1 Tax=Mucilaginibacter pineti TaxID=1391627 RepID=A0A1G7LSB1_9SPHI|nr:hypothetical protein [Mucilaginibacter pineti]SDF52407.1 hypothetical protein SAMN05216464_11989 [Mucilaginibacter pineti]
MKQLSIFFLVLLLFPACKKEATDSTKIIVEPPPTKIISSDTLTTGQQWGLTIGQSSADLYAKIQEIRAERKITNLSVVGSVFTNLEGLENKIPLYTSIYLDKKVGTSTGIQIYFSNNKVKSIYTNDGVVLPKWPMDIGVNSTVAVGDNIDGIYNKLVAIKKISAYTSRFEYIGIFDKDITKVYDPQMSASPQWYFSVSVGDKKYNRVQLNFTSGKLVSIYSSVVQTE